MVLVLVFVLWIVRIDPQWQQNDMLTRLFLAKLSYLEVSISRDNFLRAYTHTVLVEVFVGAVTVVVDTPGAVVVLRGILR